MEGIFDSTCKMYCEQYYLFLLYEYQKSIFIKVEECLRFFTVMILQSDCKENKKHINHDLISTVFENTNILYIFNDSRSLSTKNCLISSKSLISPSFCAISSQFC